VGTKKSSLKRTCSGGSRRGKRKSGEYDKEGSRGVGGQQTQDSSSTGTLSKKNLGRWVGGEVMKESE